MYVATSYDIKVLISPHCYFNMVSWTLSLSPPTPFLQGPKSIAVPETLSLSPPSNPTEDLPSSPMDTALHYQTVRTEDEVTVFTTPL